MQPFTSRVLIVIAGLMVALAGCERSFEEQEPKAKKHIVRIEGMVFQPASLVVSPGDSVVWINKDLVPHATAAAGAGLDSKTIDFNKSFSFTFSNPGEFEYVCPFHPTMKGKVQVR